MKVMHVWSPGVFVMALSCAPSYASVIEHVDHAPLSGDVLVIAQGAGGGGGSSGGGSTGSGSSGGMGSGSTSLAGWGAGGQAAEPSWDHPEELVPARGPAGPSRAVEQVGLVQDGPGPAAPPLVAARLEWVVGGSGSSSGSGR